MSRKRSSSGDSGCLVALFPLILVLGIIGTVLEFIAENIGIILIVLAVVGAIIGIVVAINNATKKKEAEEAEKQKNLAIINAPETKPSLTNIPTSSSFANKEEESVNLAFREFLRHNNDVVLANGHLDFLTNKANAFRALGKNEEALQIDSEITQAKTALSAVQSKKSGTFESKFNAMFYRATEIRNAYSTFINKLPNERLPLIGDFFQSPSIKVVKTGTNTALIFTPCYLLSYSGPGQNLRLIQYKDASVSTWITTEILNGTRLPNDEIEHIGYRYETKDGYRDMRYSYSNNPSYTFVYRGEATIRCGSITYEQKFTNKSLTEDFEKQFKNYLGIVNGKYKNIISLLLEHNAELEMSGSLDEFIARQAAAEKLRVAAEKAEAEKKEKERKEREAALAVKRKKEQEERDAAEREKQRKAEFMRNLTIVDGTLTNWYGNERNFVLPEGLASVIGTAFRWKNNLETVSIANGVKTIQANAFYGSSALKKVELPASVSSIGKEAFFGCSSLTDIVLPKAINTITAQMFGKCSSLKTLTIPVGVKKIERGAFSGCSSLTEIVVPEGVTTVEDDAFENCVKLKKVVLPNSITKFGKNVFSGCVSLEHVTLGNGIKRIPEACFNNHQKLIDVAVASDIVEIGDRAFRNCQKLSSLTFIEKDKSSMAKGMDFERMITGATSSNDRFALDSLERIGKSAFENCFAFKGIELKDGIRTIAEYAFANCRSIKTIILPKTIQTFGTGAFTGCTSLLEVDGAENVRWQKKNCFTGSPWLASQATDGFVIFDDYLEAYTGTDTSVEIPQNVKTIGRSAFDGNAYVTSIQISNGVATIEELAFANCKKLRTVFIPDSVSHIEDNAFSGNTDFLIQCSRGSAASAFRIRNKLPGEYVAKTKPENKDKTATKRTRSSVGDGLSGLSEEELRVIMEMRREKIAQKKAEENKPVIPERIEYSFVQFDSERVSLILVSEGRKITNNIFNLKFEQNERADEKAPAEYETFVVDAFGQIISDIKTINANKDSSDLTHKVTYSLSAQEKFDKAAEYFVILRYKNAGLNILSKTQYQISIDFASDFDF
ncbi:leucine-rich repeat domain-containing protein [Oscillospiraceae bacterium LCP21S3_E10]